MVGSDSSLPRRWCGAGRHLLVCRMWATALLAALILNAVEAQVEGDEVTVVPQGGASHGRRAHAPGCWRGWSHTQAAVAQQLSGGGARAPGPPMRLWDRVQPSRAGWSRRPRIRMRALSSSTLLRVSLEDLWAKAGRMCLPTYLPQVEEGASEMPEVLLFQEPG